nr:uncharacterized protein LOC122272160 isoform X1 [Parasteatoda tepidariorum]
MPSSKRITITKEQWQEMLNKYIDISGIVLDFIFKNMNFLDAFKNVCESPIDKALPSSLDTSLGEQYLENFLKRSICDISIDNGMKEPRRLAEEQFGNRDETFNSYAFPLEAMELAERFYSNLFDRQKFLLLPPLSYATEEFFENLHLHFVLRSAREFMCPSDTFEYFKDFD